MCPHTDEDGEDRCSTCLVGRLEAAMQSRPGQLLRAAFDFDWALENGFPGDLNQISCEEFSLLKTIRFERNRLQQQQSEEQHRAHERRVRQIRARQDQQL